MGMGLLFIDGYMTRKKHPNKEIEEVLKYAEVRNWRVENSNGHPFGQMYCPYSRSISTCESSEKWCRVSLWSTPKNTGSHARQLKKVVDRCMKKQVEIGNE